MKDYKDKVVDELLNTYDIDEEEAEELCDKHKDIVSECLRMGSYAYYAVDRIAEHELGLVLRGEDDYEEDFDDEDDFDDLDEED